MKTKFIYQFIILSCIISTYTTSYSQSLNKLSTDPKKQEPMLIGYCDRKGLEKEAFSAWFKKGYEDYKLDETTLVQLKKKLKKVKITLVMGTWCSDSKREVPRFFKILDYLKYKTRKKNITILCVDRDKKAGDTDYTGLTVQYVPTMIFSKDGKELGRIVESPVESLEKDMLKYLGSDQLSK